MPNAVLYVRDALRLPLDGQPTGAPPHLIDEIPDRSGLIEGVDLTVAAAEWAAWWTAISALEAQVQQQGGESAVGLRSEYRTIVDPETSPALSGSLRLAAQTLYRDGCRWVDAEARPYRRARDNPLAGFEWHLIRDAVEEVAAEAGVDTGAVSGAVSVVFVEGVWGTVAAPGFAWCSLAAAEDPRVCSEITRAALLSGLTPLSA